MSTYHNQIYAAHQAERARNDARLAARQAEAAKLDAERNRITALIVEAGEQVAVEMSDVNLQALADAISAAKTHCSEIGPVVRNSQTLPRVVGTNRASFYSIIALLMKGALRVDGLDRPDCRVSPDSLTGWTIKRGFINAPNPIHVAVTRAVEAPSPDSLRVALFALACWCESLEFTCSNPPRRTAYAPKASRLDVNLQMSRTFDDRPDKGWRYEEMLEHVARVVFDGAPIGDVYRSRLDR